MRYILIIAIFVVLVGGILFVTGEDGTDQITRSSVTETAGSEGTRVISTPETTPTPLDTVPVVTSFEDDAEIERRALASLQEDSSIERRAHAPRTTPSEPHRPLTAADGAEPPRSVAPRAPEQFLSQAPNSQGQLYVADELDLETATQVVASNLVSAPQSLQTAARHAPEGAVSPVPVGRLQALVAHEFNLEEAAQAVTSEVITAPQSHQAAATHAREGAVSPVLVGRRQALVANGLGRNEEAAKVVTSGAVTLPGIAGAPPLFAAAKPAIAEGSRAERATVATLGSSGSARYIGPGGLESTQRPTPDVVHFSATGGAVLANHPEPGAEVLVLDRGTDLGRAKASQHGDWVLVPLKPLPPGTRELSIRASLPGLPSPQTDDVLVLSVPPRTGSRITRTGPPVELTLPGGAEMQVFRAPRRPADAVGLDAVGLDAVGLDAVGLDAVDYDKSGKVVLSGRAGADTEIRVYADDRLVGMVRSDKAGGWQLRPGDRITPGYHELRIESTSGDGNVLAQSVVPFSRADLQDLESRDGSVVVQPGTSLWRIARATYGTGFKYSLIYEVNRDQIDDPDLIFPGQVFRVPVPN